MSASLHYLTLAEILARYKSRELSPVEMVKASLDRIEQVNAQINAIYYLDPKGALEAAAQSERRWKAGTPIGTLDGIPTTVKDILPAVGMPGQFLGAAGQPGLVADTDHPTVARMREAGAIILGKNTMCDYGILAAGYSSKFGPTRNPWNLSRTSGASSAGAAASVAAGIEPVSIGTDIVGSIRVPASFCGLAGLKPSRGRVPYYFPNSPALVAGPLARNVTDLALHLNVLARPDKRDFTTLPYDPIDYTVGLDDLDPASLRLLVITDLGLGEAPGPDTVSAIKNAAHEFERQGATVDIRDKPVFERKGYRAVEKYYKVRYREALTRLPAEQAIQAKVIWEWTQEAEGLSAVELYRLAQQSDLMREAAANLIDGYDFVLLPATANTAFEAELPARNPDEIFEPWANTFLFNLTEQPAGSVPCGRDSEGLPIGLQIVGKRFDDVGVIRLARFYERLAPKLGFPSIS